MTDDDAEFYLTFGYDSKEEAKSAMDSAIDQLYMFGRVLKPPVLYQEPS
ncbi:hypothetical protein OVA03_14275 [Asticcacaulis sp. SL142]|nr:hypothetical protein [Asticcacaulis sp. SL142]WAC47855.1 hypothetical protein OVA03_14275 [Asticcacaulis sp. SL142]